MLPRALNARVKHLQATLKQIVSENFLPGDDKNVATYGALLSYLDQDLSTVGSGHAAAERAAGLYLLCEALKTVPRPLILAKQTVIFNIVATAIAHEFAHETNVLFATKCLGRTTAIAAEHLPQYASAAVGASTTLCALAVGTHPRVRKCASNFLCSLMSKKTDSQINKNVGREIIQCLKEVQNYEQIQTIVAVVELIEILVPSLPEKSLTALMDPCIAMTTMGSCELSAHVFNVFTLVLTSCLSWPDNKLHTLYSCIVQLRPAKTDAQVVFHSWLLTVQAGFTCLARSNPQQAASRIIELISDTLFTLLRHESPAIVKSAFATINTGLECCFVAHEGLATAQACDASGVPLIQKLLDLFETGFSLPFLNSWGFVIDLYSTVARNLDSSCSSILSRPTLLMGVLREKPGFPNAAEVDNYLAAVTECLGPQFLLTNLPLNMGVVRTKETGQARTYLLPLMAKSIACTHLSYFCTYFLPLIDTISANIEQFVADGQGDAAKEQGALRYQMWMLLPGFCIYPRDLKESFSAIGSRLGEELQTNLEIRPIVCRALRNLVDLNRELIDAHVVPDLLRKRGYTSETARGNLRGLVVSSRYFLPLLFNVLLESTLGSASSSSACEKSVGGSSNDVAGLIQSFTSIADADVVEQLYGQIMAPLQDTVPVRLHEKTMFVVLAGMVIPRLQDPSQLVRLYELAVDGIATANLAKGFYRLLTLLVAHERGRAVFKERWGSFYAFFVAAGQPQKQPAMHCNNSAIKRERLKLFSAIIEHTTLFERSHWGHIVTEARTASTTASLKCREAAYELLSVLGHHALNSVSADTSGALGVVVSSAGGDEPMDGNNIPYDSEKNREQSILESLVMQVASPAAIFASSSYSSAALSASNTPRNTLISAGIRTATRLVREFRTSLSPEFIDRFLIIVFKCSTCRSAEVLRSVYAFLQLFTSRFPTDLVEPKLPRIVTALFGMVDIMPNVMRVLTGRLVRSLCRKHGIEEIDYMVPKPHQALVRNISKSLERSSKRSNSEPGAESGTRGGKLAAPPSDDDDGDGNDTDGRYDSATVRRVSAGGNAALSRLAGARKRRTVSAFDQVVNECDEEDENEEGGLKRSGRDAAAVGRGGSRGSRHSRKKNKCDSISGLILQSRDGLVDLLDGSALTSSVHEYYGAQSTTKGKKANAAYRTRADGKMIIEGSDDEDCSEVENDSGGSDLDDDDDEDDGSDVEPNATRGTKKTTKIGFPARNPRSIAHAKGVGLGSRRPNPTGGAVALQQRRGGKEKLKLKLKPTTLRDAAGKYSSKKAGGDVKRSGVLDPYAYIPLSRKSAGSRNRAAATTTTTKTADSKRSQTFTRRKIKKHKK